MNICPALKSIDSSKLHSQLINLLNDKKAAHWLQDGYTSATETLSCWVFIGNVDDKVEYF